MTQLDCATELDAPYPLSAAQIERYRTDGYIKLKEALSAETLTHYAREITRQVFRLNEQTTPLEKRDTYGKAFLQITNLWRQSDVVRELVHSRRLARIAAELMRVQGVRLYHDQALYKEAGGGITPWHADQYYWPLSNSNTTTAWIPLQATPREMGPLAFSVGSQRYTQHRDLAISDDSEKKINKALLEQGLPQDDGPFDLGEVSFHGGWTFHRAGANTSARPRQVMTIIYMEDGIRVIQPRSKAHQADWEQWLPGTQIDGPAAGPLNPVLWRRGDEK